jgi:group I intron endonuclease
MTSCLYWYHLSTHTDIFTQGYVGVSNNIKYRDSYHRSQNDNPHLTRAFAKYKNDLILEIIIEDTEEYCLDLENYLRPEKQIGWNIAIGGGKPPSRKGQTFSEEWKKEMSKRISGENHPLYNIGHSQKSKVLMSISQKKRFETETVWNKGKKMSDKARQAMKVPHKKREIPLDFIEKLQELRTIRKLKEYYKTGGSVIERWKKSI